MRAGLNFFDKCFSAKKTKRWRSQIRKVTKNLGQARDRDVQIEFIKKFLSNLDKGQRQYKQGIKRLLLRLEQSRQKIQPKVVKSVGAFYSSGVLADMHGEIEKILFSSRGGDVQLQSHFIFQESNERIREQLNNLLSDQDSLTNPLDKDGHHRMRISAKRFRYTLEICNIAFDGKLKEIIKAVKKAQTYLGDIHDLDLWQEYLEKFTIEEKQKTVEYLGHTRSFASIQKGLNHLNVECVKQRDILFIEFVKYWNRISEEGLWNKLQSIINLQLEEYQESSEINLTA
jgi:CHAD domain-containing protein